MKKYRYYCDIETLRPGYEGDPIIRIERIYWEDKFQKPIYRGLIMWPPTVILAFTTIYLWWRLSLDTEGFSWIIWVALGCCVWLILSSIFLFILDMRHINRKYKSKIGT